MSILKVTGTAGLLLLSTTGAAAEKMDSPWKSSAEVGYVNTSGNTNTETLRAAYELSYEIEKWAHKIHADALSSKTETTDDTVTPAVTSMERSAAKWLVSGQSDYKFTEYNYFYGLLSYEDDRFSGFEYQAKLGVGYGRRVIHTDKHDLRLEVGPGYRSYRLEQPAPPAPAEERRDEMLLRMNAGYIWKISETSKFTQELTYEAGENQDEWKSVTGLTARINATLAMKLTHAVKKLDAVPPGTEHYDRETAVTLVFTF